MGIDTRSAAAVATPRETDLATLPMTIVLLLAFAVFINYVDRGSLATAAPLIQDQLHLSPTEMGILLSAFFWSYTPLQLVAGWLAQRFDVRYVYAGGLALWSLATALTGLISSFAILLMLRVLVGIGESVALPCNSKLLADGVPEHQRGRANGLVSVGFGLGPAFGTLMGGALMAHWGWRAVFVVFGLASLLWVWPWLNAMSGVSVRRPSREHPHVSYFAILRQRAAWGASLGHFCSNYGIYFVLTWLPLYLVKSRGFSVEQMALIGACVYGVYALSSAVTGWASDRWLAKGASVNRVRKSMMVMGMLGGAGCLFLQCANLSGPLSALLLGAAAICFGFVSPQVFAIAQTLAGRDAAAQWTGLQNMLANFAGILAPLITGILVERTGEYFWAFGAVGAILMLGAFAWGVIIPRVAPVRWTTE